MAIEKNEAEKAESITEQFADLYDTKSSMTANRLNQHHLSSNNQSIPYHQIEYLHDINVDLFVELGHNRISLGDLLNLKKGNVIKANKSIGEPVDILAGETMIARGEVVIVNERIGIRVTEVMRPLEREIIDSQGSLDDE